MTRSPRLVDCVSFLLTVLLLTVPTASPVWADEADGPDSVREAPAKLSGTYTIGDGADYDDFGGAVSDLKSQGVSGAVTFKVEDGTYSEHVKIPEIDGASSSNTITFKPKSDDSVAVEASGSGNDEPLRLNDADHLRFERITLNATGSGSPVRAAYLKGTVENVKFEEVQFLSREGGVFAKGRELTGLYAEGNTVTKDLIVSGCVFDRSAGGIVLRGDSDNPSSGAEFRNNVFGTKQGKLSRRGIRLDRYEGPTITDNTIKTAPDNDNFKIGINLRYNSGSPRITKNDVEVSKDGIVVRRTNASSGDKGLIANNEITLLTVKEQTGLKLNNSKGHRVYHNSVNVTRRSKRKNIAFHAEGDNSGSVVRNNIFVAEAGKAMKVENGENLTLNHNNLYTNGPVPVTYNGTHYGLVSRYQQGESQGTGSASAPPVFASTTDLTPESPFVDDEGADLTGTVPKDIDGTPRSTPVSLGAREVDPTTTPTKLTKDTYTVGGASPDYATIYAAIQDLKKRGVDAGGTVTFNVREGTYGTGADGAGNPLVIPHIGGTDLPTGENPIVFTSASEDRNRVSIRASGAKGSEPLRLAGADYVSFEHLTFQATNTGGTVRVVFLKSRVDGVGFQDSQIITSATGGGEEEQVGLYAERGTVTSELTVFGCTFSGGASGIYLNGNPNIPSASTQISSNAFGTSGLNEQTRRGIFLSDQKKGRVTNVRFNTIVSEAGNGNYKAGIELKDSKGTIRVDKNDVEVGNNGIVLDELNAAGGEIVNNEITLLTARNAVGLKLDKVKNLQVYHNSVNVTAEADDFGTNVAFRARNDNSGSKVKNNLFVAEASKAMNVDKGGTLTLGHNGLYTRGPVLVHYNGTDYSDLHGYRDQTTSPDQGTGSVFAPPAFLSETDLTPESPFVDDEGEDVGVSSDIEGNSRGASPSLGAHEFTAPKGKLTKDTYTVGGSSPDYDNLYKAIEALKTRGVAGNVTFDVRDGTYGKGANGNALVIPPIAGLRSTTRGATFRSVSGDSTDVIVKASGDNQSEPLRLFGVDNVNFEQLTFRATSSADNDAVRAVYLKSRLRNVNFYNVRFQSHPGDKDEKQVGLFGERGSITHVEVVDCSFGGGASGVYLAGNSNTYTSSVVFDSNDFGTGSLEDQTRYGIRLRNQGAPRFIGAWVWRNRIVSDAPTGDFKAAIKLKDSGGEPLVRRNDIEVRGNGIVFQQVDASSSDKGLIANNEITLLTARNQAGLVLRGARNQEVYHNSVNITAETSDYGTNVAFRAWKDNSGSVVKNNLFVAEGSKVMNVDRGGTFTLGYNGLHTTGSVLVHYNGADYSDLSGYKGTGQGTESVSEDPMFSSNTDLTPGNSKVDEEGADLINVVPVDIDTDPRSAPPTLGAQEINIGLTVAGGGANNMDFDPSISAGTDNNPVGLFQLTAGKSGATLTTVSVTNGSPGVSGIKQARLYRSSDQTFNAGSDTELATFDVDEASAEETFVFDGFSQSVPTSGGYLFLAIDVKSTAPGSNIQFRIKDESDLEVPNGGIATVNGQSATSLSALPLNTATAAPVKTMSKNVNGDGTEDFGETGTDIQFSGVSSPGEVTVNRYDEKPSNPQGISESTVSSYRLTIDEGSRFAFSSAEIAFAVSELRGISDPSKVTVYKRDTEGAGSFNALTTTVEDNGTPDDVTDDTLYATSDSFSEFVFASDSEALPVEMARFDARLDDEQVRLTWATASETGNAGFEVQREKESAGWATVGRVEGAGTTTRSQRYRFVDENLPYDADSLTYRLRQVDTDGSAHFSKTVTVARDVQAIELKGTYPNPAHQEATVHYALPEKQETTIRLYDVLGRRVRTLVSAKKEGRQETTLDVSDLSSGVYFLRLRADGTIKTQKLTVVR